MKNRKFSRRDLLKGASVVVAGSTFSTRVLASAPPPEPVTQALVDAAKKEGQVSYYTSTDLPVAEKVAKAFEAKYPGISRPHRAHRRRARVPAHRPGIFLQHPRRRCRQFLGRRAFHRLEARRHSVALRARGCREIYPAEHRDVDGQFASFRVWLVDHRLQHQSGESQRKRRRALPTCSIPNGRARSSRRIRAIAAPS